MARAVKNPFKKERKGIDLTPLIDCVFLILIFFMITANFLKKDKFKVQIPKVNKAEKVRTVDQVVDLYIDKFGGYRMGDDVDTIISKVELREKLMPHKHMPVIFKVDKDAPSEFLTYGIGVAYELEMEMFSIQVQAQHR